MKPDEVDKSKNIWVITQRTSRTAAKEVLKCEFCEGPHSIEGVPGSFLPNPFVLKKDKKTGKILQSGWVHRACADLSPLVFVDDQGGYCKVVDEIKRGKKIKCFMPNCRKSGATIGCLVSKCNKSVHVACAVESGWKFGSGTSAFLCPDHRPISLQKKREEEFYAKIRAKEEAENAKKKKEDLIAAKKKQEEDRRLESERKSSRRSTRTRNAPVSYTDAPAIRAVQKQEVEPKKKELNFHQKKRPIVYASNLLERTRALFGLSEVCENWFHPKCVGLATSFARRIADGDETWVCPECAEMTGKFGLKAMEALQAAGAASTAENTGNSGSPQRNEIGFQMETSPNANKKSGKKVAKELSL